MPQDHISKLPINELQPNPFQPRGKISHEHIEELVNSVKQYGILEPLVIAQTPAGYQIIAGERRWRAAKAAGLTEVPVIVRKTSPKGMLEMAIIENVQRVDLSPIERAQAFQQLIRDFGFTHSQIAERVGKSSPYISNTLKLLRLPDAINDGLVGGLISEGHARALVSIEDEKLMIECYKQVLKESASVRRCEDLARRYKNMSGQMTGDTSDRRQIVNSDEIDQWVKSLQETFHRKNQIKLSRSHKQTKLTITLKGSPEETQADLNKILAITETNQKKAA